MSLGSKIKEAREFLGISQNTLAERVGISRVAIGYYERGVRVPNVEILKKIAQGLHTNIDYLLEKTEYYDT
ncbi:MAG: helix-turn-helix domain-containing protein, partial [Bacillota bacterium]